MTLAKLRATAQEINEQWYWGTPISDPENGKQSDKFALLLGSSV